MMNLIGQRMHNMIDSMISDKNKLRVMGENAKKIAINDAEDRIYREIKKVLNTKRLNKK